jgi:hypothetical protein
VELPNEPLKIEDPPLIWGKLLFHDYFTILHIKSSEKSNSLKLKEYIKKIRLFENSLYRRKGNVNIQLFPLRFLPHDIRYGYSKIKTNYPI